MQISGDGEVVIYTDGSCHTQKRVGAWVAILLHNHKEIVLSGTALATTHNRMELLAVIKAIEYVGNNIGSSIVIKIITDSQYVVGLPERSAKLINSHFITHAGKDLKNIDLLQIFFQLFATHVIHLHKIKAHQKKETIINHNITADKLSRNMVRQLIMEMR